MVCDGLGLPKWRRRRSQRRGGLARFVTLRSTMLYGGEDVHSCALEGCRDIKRHRSAAGCASKLLAPAARPRPIPLRFTEPAFAASSTGAVAAELTRGRVGVETDYFSGFSRRLSSFSTASRMKTAIRRLPTRAWMRPIISAGSLTVVGFIPSGGRPIASSLSTGRTMSNFIIVDATVYRVYDAV